MYESLPWNNIRYKPESRISDEFWHEFMSAAKMLLILDYNMSDEEKRIRNWVEPDIYAVFDKLRQDYHDELPYNKRFIDEIDRSIEREVRKELRAYE